MFLVKSSYVHSLPSHSQLKRVHELDFFTLHMSLLCPEVKSRGGVCVVLICQFDEKMRRTREQD